MKKKKVVVIIIVLVFALGLCGDFVFKGEDKIISLQLDATSSGATRVYYANYTIENGMLVTVDSSAYFSDAARSYALFCSEVFDFDLNEWRMVLATGYDEITASAPSICGEVFGYRSYDEIRRDIDDGRLVSNDEFYCHASSGVKGCYRVFE